MIELAQAVLREEVGFGEEDEDALRLFDVCLELAYLLFGGRWEGEIEGMKAWVCGSRACRSSTSRKTCTPGSSSCSWRLINAAANEGSVNLSGSARQGKARRQGIVTL